METTITSFEALPAVLQASDLQQVLHLSKGKVYQLLASEGFPSLCFGKRKMVVKSDFLDWLEQNKANNSKE